MGLLVVFVIPGLGRGVSFVFWLSFIFHEFPVLLHMNLLLFLFFGLWLRACRFWGSKGKG